MSQTNPVDPFKVLLQAVAATPQVASSRAVRYLYGSAIGGLGVAIVATVTYLWHPSNPARWSALVAVLIAQLAWLIAVILDTIPLFNKLRDVPGTHLKHLSACHAGEAAVIEELRQGFTLLRLEDTEARLTQSIAQMRRRISRALPVKALATPAAVAVAFVAPKLVGLDLEAGHWPSGIFVALGILAFMVPMHHEGADTLERAALLLQRAIARKREQAEAQT